MKQRLRLLCLPLLAMVASMLFASAPPTAQVVINAAQIGDTKYLLLSEAVAAVPTDGSETTITMLSDVTLHNNTGITFSSGMNVILNLNGHTVSQEVTENAASQLILNEGSLTITDNSQSQDGKLTNSFASGVSASTNYANHIILNKGILTINSGKIESSGETTECAAIASTNTIGNATLNINGGNIKGNPFAVNLIAASNHEINFNMTNGVIYSSGISGFLFESQTDASPTKGNINISGGTLTGYENAIQAIEKGNNENVTYTITGGTFNGDVEGFDSPMAISGGTFNGHVRNWLNWQAPMSVTGGKFAKDIYVLKRGDFAVTKNFITGGVFKSKTYDWHGSSTNCEWCNSSTSLAVGHAAVPNTDPETMDEYPWTVISLYVCAIEDTKYLTLEEAVAAVPTTGAETTITMLKDYTVQEGNSGVTISSDKKVVLDLNGMKVSQNVSTSAASQVILNQGFLTITDNSENQDGTMTHSFADGVTTSNNYGNYIVLNEGTLTVNAGNIQSVGTSTNSAAVASNNTSGTATLNVNGGKITGNPYAVDLIAANNNQIIFNMTDGEITSSGKAGLIFESKAEARPAIGSGINISGGTLTGSEDAIQAVENGNNENVTYTITGGTFNGDVEGFDSPMAISGGTFNGHVRNLLNWQAPMSVTGGKFAKDVYTTKDDENSAITKNFITGGVFMSKTYDWHGSSTNCDWCNSSESLANGYIVIDNPDTETYNEGYLYAVANEVDLNTVDLVHGEPYPYPEGKECLAVNYWRTFSGEANKYRSWYVPFDYTVSETDLEKFKFYKLHMIAASGQAQGGEVTDVTQVYIYISSVGAGTILTANRPYVIVPQEDMNNHKFRAENISQVYPEDNTSRLHLESAEFNYDFYGTYREYGATRPYDWYALSKNGEISGNATANAKLQSYVWAMKVTARDENSDYGNINFTFVDGSDTDMISVLSISEDNMIEGFYTIDGAKVEEPVKGINIIRFVDGRTKKIFVK